MLILVTGKSGGGKTTLAEILAKKLNYTHIDIDKIGLSVYEFPDVIEKAKKLFGNEIFENGVLNKNKLGQMVFNERDSIKVSNFRALTWKYIDKVIEETLTDNAVIEYILLPNTKFWKLNAIKILIKATNNKQRKQNVMIRDNINIKSVETRDKFSIEYDENDFNFIFKNNYKLKHLEQNADKVVNFIKSNYSKYWSNKKDYKFKLKINL